MKFPDGAHIDLRTGDSEQDDPARAQSWGPERLVRADVIRDLLVGRRSADGEGTVQSPSVFLSGARITGRLDLRGFDVSSSLLLQGCAFDEPLVIADSIFRSVRLYACRLPGIEGAWLKCADDLHLRDCQIDGTIDLSGAYIGGQLVLSSSTLRNPGGVALRADHLVVAAEMFCREELKINGGVSLRVPR